MSRLSSDGVDNPTYDSYEPGANPQPLMPMTQKHSILVGPILDNVQQINLISTKPIVDTRRQMSVIAEPVSMSWHNIDVFSHSKSGLFKKNKKLPVHIIKNVTGQVNAGQVLAIMGASGAGKTTLMNVLTQRNISNLDVKGSVKLNGKIADVNSITSLSAYVQQDDIFISTLTVREHLKFHSRVRMDQNVPENARHDRIEQILQDIGLTKCADTMIGKPEDVKGISGGEKKRLAFASELLTNPSILFCDEPTSGLDSFMAMSVVEVLKEMAQSGRTIICTIHQPSSEVFSIFDQLLLMADGKVAYMGKLEKAVDFFSSAGLNCPINYNPADFFIQNLAVIPGKEKESKEIIHKICDKYADSQFAKESMPTETSAADLYHEITVKQNRSVYKTSWFIQFWALLWRSSIASLREPMVTRVRIIQTVFVALLLGFIYWQIELDDQSGIQNINGALFLLLTNLNFQNAFAVVNTFCVEIPLFLREHNNGMYRVSAYFLSKMLAELPIFILIPVLFVSIFYFMVGLNSGLTQFLLCVLICVLMATSACSFGYLVSCVSSSVTMALALGPPLMVPMLIFGGFFLSNKSVPVYFIWLKYVSWFYYANEALMINQWQNIDITCPTSAPINGTAIEYSSNCVAINGKQVIKQFNFNEDYFSRNIIILLGLTIIMRVLAYLALLLKARRR